MVYFDNWGPVLTSPWVVLWDGILLNGQLWGHLTKSFLKIGYQYHISVCEESLEEYPSNIIQFKTIPFNKSLI